MIIAGIDPGKTGAMVHLFPNDDVLVFRVPLMTDKGKEVACEAEWARTWGCTEAADMYVIERVGSMPAQGRAGQLRAAQGISSTFKFGVSFGFVKALAYMQARPTHLVTPAQWKTKMGLQGAGKNASRELARRMLPKLAPHITRVKDDGVAEAALLALYGRRYLR